MDKKKLTTNAVEIMHRRYIKGWWCKLLYYCWYKPISKIENKIDIWRAKRILRKEKNWISLEDFEKELFEKDSK